MSFVLALALLQSPADPAPPAAPPAVEEAQASADPLEALLEELETARASDAAPLLEKLVAGHSGSPELERAVRVVARHPPSLAVEEFLRAAAHESPHDPVRGFATYELAHLLLKFDATLEQASDADRSEEERAAFVARRGAALLEALEARGREALRRAAADSLRKVVDDHYFLDHREAGYLGAAAEAELFELERLQVGMVAPEIEGADEDAVPFKLSDYRGKVVALDFWGFWCPLCVVALPQERVLVERLRDEPFALVGVNSDSRPQLETALRHDRISWRSFFDGGDAFGPIARQWNVTSWPTVYVLDEDGVIRLKTEDHDAVERKVDELLAAQRAKAGAR
jgi:peroxiredoxin